MNNGHGGDIYSLKNPVIDFSSNINPLGMPEAVKEAILGCLDSCSVYPDVSCRILRGVIAAHDGACENQIVCGNGAADIIYRLVYYMKPKKALLLAPTFSEYESALKCVGCDIEYYRLTEESGFTVGDDILPRINGKDIVFICNPNNPTGQITSIGMLEKINAETINVNAALVVDECFLDFVPTGRELSALPFLAQNHRLVIIKAFTKFYAMAGLRLGYAICNEEICAGINGFGAPWSVSAIAQAAGAAAFDDNSYAEKTLELVESQRAYLKKELEKLSLRAFNSHANYILIKSHIHNLKELLIPRGFLIRDCGNYYCLDKGFYRIAVKSHADNVALISALKKMEG